MERPQVDEIVIRAAEASDLEALVRFNQGIALETEGKQLDNDTLSRGVAAVLGDESLGFYTVATCNDQVVACLMVTREWSDWRNGVFWWIQSVYVDAAFRRQGIYRKLYQHVKLLASKHNVCGFRLYVEKDNTIAQQTYADQGMHETVYRMFEQLSAKS